MDTIERLYMSIEEATKRYGIGRSAIYELFANAACPVIRKYNHKTLIPIKEFDAFIDSYLGYYAAT